LRGLGIRQRADSGKGDAGNGRLVALVVSTGLLRRARGEFSRRPAAGILHAIYAHEVLQPETLVDLYQNSRRKIY
jgi:hypothetical protein